MKNVLFYKINKGYIREEEKKYGLEFDNIVILENDIGYLKKIKN